MCIRDSYSINERVVPRCKAPAYVERIAAWIDFQRKYAIVNRWPEVLVQKTRVDVVGKDVRLGDRGAIRPLHLLELTAHKDPVTY